MSAPERFPSPEGPQVPDREVAPGLWLRKPGTRKEFLELVIPASEVPERLRQRRERIATSFPIAHLIWTSGPADTLFEGEGFGLPEWDDIEGIVGAAQAADAALVRGLIRQGKAGERTEEERETIGHLDDLLSSGRIKIIWEEPAAKDTSASP